MKIVYLNSLARMGGTEWSLLDMMGVVRRARPDWEMTLVLPEAGPLGKRAAKLGVNVRVCELPSSIAALGDSGLDSPGAVLRRLARGMPVAAHTAGYLARLRSLLREEAPDIVHSNGNKTHLMSALVRPSEAALIWHLRDFVSPRPLVWPAMRALHHRAALVVANSHAVADDARRVLPGARVEAVYNAVDGDRFVAEGPVLELDALSHLPTAPSNAVRVGLVGTFARWKGHDVFLEAAAQVCRRAHFPVRFYVVGGPIYDTAGSQWSREELEARARDLGIADRVGFTGFQFDTPAVYRALDVVVHASTQPEPFGRTIVEAMACGRTVLVARAGGAAELFDDGVTAVGVTPGDASALANAILAVGADPEGRARMAGLASQHAHSTFSLQRLSESLHHVYELARQKRGA